MLSKCIGTARLAKTVEKRGFFDVLEAAEVELMDRRSIEIAPKDWHKIEKLMESPPKPVRGIEKLAKHAPSWKR